MRAASTLVLLLALATPVLAQPAAPPAPSPAKKTFQVPRAAGPIHVDGALDEPAWQQAAVIPILYEWTPGDNTTPPVATEALVTYDHENLYVGWRAHDPEPGKIRAHLMDRDSIDTFVQDDHVVMLLDTFNDERRAYQFRVNPLGVQADAINSEVDQSEDWSFDLIWDSAGRITADGYEVEIAIPWKQIRFPRGGDLTMGIEVGRSWPRSVRHRMADHRTDRNLGCGFCQYNKIAGISGVEPGRNLELDPTVTAHRTDERSGFPDGGLESGKTTVDPGLTMRWGVTPNVSLAAAANPDFSQVEADVAQLSENERFALFYPEKRPFFLEGGDFFATPIQAVFTRTVADPKWGLKATGKIGPSAGGLFVTEDSLNNLIFPANQFSDFASLADDVTGSVLRYRRDVLKRSTVGVLYAGREGQDGDQYHNRVAGVDGNLQLGDSDAILFQFLHSDTQYPAAVAAAHGQPLDAFGGNGSQVSYFHTGRDWLVNLLLQDLAEGFRADSGFVPRVDVRTADGTLTRRFFPQPGDWWSQANVGVEALRTDDHHGQLTDEGLYLFGQLGGPLQSNLNVTYGREKTFFEGVLYENLDRYRLVASVQPSGLLKLGLTAQVRDAIDFVNNRPADAVFLNPTIELKPGRHLNLQLNHTYQRLEVLHGQELFTANLSQLRVVYNFSVRSFVRAIAQYQDITRNPDVYTVPVQSDTQTLFTQLLFSYKLNPQTVLFVGYSDNALGFEAQDVQKVDLTRTDRTFFVKVGYAFLF